MTKTTFTPSILRLKQRARQLSRESGTPLHQALDQIARDKGFRRWSLLAARHSNTDSNSSNNSGSNSGNNSDSNSNNSANHQTPLEPLESGDLILVAARPGQGKTIACLEVLLSAVNAGCRGLFFTLEYNQAQAAEKLRAVAGEIVAGERGTGLQRVEIDSSDDISAPYIIERLSSTSDPIPADVDKPAIHGASTIPARNRQRLTSEPSAASANSSARPGTVVVIDYLQLLDQRRTSPDLNEQLLELKRFAVERGICMIFISQVHRSFDMSTRRFPGLEDIRLPNPVDLAVFNKACFLHNREIVCNPIQ